MPPRQHAILSASSSHRWLHCTPSARLEQKFEDRETEAAKEGTAAHALCEHKLRCALKVPSEKPNSPYDCEEMDFHTDGYVQFVLETITEARQHCADPIINIEQCLDFSCYVPEGFGTGDCVIVSDQTLHIIDFKYGRGVLVEAENNPQMMLYALGALHVYDSLYDIKEVAMTVYQPRRENISTWTIPVDELKAWVENTLKPKAALAYEGKGDYIAMDTRSRDELTGAMQKLTELDNPNSVMQMKTWLADNGLETDSLGKKQVAELLERAPKPLADVLLLRQQLAKSSVRKYQAMENCVCADDRARGMFMFYGANRTGRFSGRLIQLQNLTRNYMSDLKEARSVIRSGYYDTARMLYDSVPDVLSELIRTAFIPYEGGKFIVADFSAIEARVIAWLAGEQWRLDVFEIGGDIYCASASQMFRLPVEKNGVNGHLRQKGKIAELALGYGGSVGALQAMGALEMGLAEDELKPLVDAWRASNPNIVKLWWDVDKVVKTCVMQRIQTEVHGIRFTYESGFLFITLPSGRRLAYVKPRIGENRFGGESVTYEGIGNTKKWERLESFGGKCVENIIQGISRDILCHAMQTLRCCKIVAHVHDELIIEADPRMSLEAVCEQMGRTPPWAPGLELRADGFVSEYYQKS